MTVGTDAPSWTFGLNPSVRLPLAPGPGTYDIAREIIAEGVGTHFGRPGCRPMSARPATSRLVFDDEKEGGATPGPGAYETSGLYVYPRGKVYPPDTTHHSTRFLDEKLATDAGPGAYIHPEFSGNGPAYTMTARPPTPLERPVSPGPGQYIRVWLSQRQGGTRGKSEGFGLRGTPRFISDEVDAPGPGDYQSPHFQPRFAKGITFGRLVRPAGWSAKIREIARFACEREEEDTARDGNITAYKTRCLRKASQASGGCRRRHLPSASPSSTLLRACARGRRYVNNVITSSGVNVEKGERATGKRSIAEVFNEAGRGRKAQVTAQSNCADGSGGRRRATAGLGGTSSSSKAAVFGTSPQRPRDAHPAPGPASYHPLTLNEAARVIKVCGIGGKSGRELFPPPPDTPGSDRYSPEVVQRRTVPERSLADWATPRGNLDDGVRTTGPTFANGISPRQSALPASISVAATAFAPGGTFGSSERFPRDPEGAQKPGVGTYDLRAAEQAVAVCSAALPVTFGQRDPAHAPSYDPLLGRYIHPDHRFTPSPHSYRPETASGSGGEYGVSGHAPAPPAWSFGRKRRDPRPPAGPGPGRFNPTYAPSPPAAKFGVGRASTPSSVSEVPWEESVERAVRGEGGGVGVKLYLPGRTRFGARACMMCRYHGQELGNSSRSSRCR